MERLIKSSLKVAMYKTGHPPKTDSSQIPSSNGLPCTRRTCPPTALPQSDLGPVYRSRLPDWWRKPVPLPCFPLDGFIAKFGGDICDRESRDNALRVLPKHQNSDLNTIFGGINLENVCVWRACVTPSGIYIYQKTSLKINFKQIFAQISMQKSKTNTKKSNKPVLAGNPVFQKRSCNLDPSYQSWTRETHGLGSRSPNTNHEEIREQLQTVLDWWSWAFNVGKRRSEFSSIHTAPQLHSSEAFRLPGSLVVCRALIKQSISVSTFSSPRQIANPIPWCGLVKLLSGPTANHPMENTAVLRRTVKIWSQTCTLIALRCCENRTIRIAAGTMKRKVIAAITAWPRMRMWYWGRSLKRFPIPEAKRSVS